MSLRRSQRLANRASRAQPTIRSSSGHLLLPTQQNKPEYLEHWLEYPNPKAERSSSGSRLSVFIDNEASLFDTSTTASATESSEEASELNEHSTSNLYYRDSDSISRTLSYDSRCEPGNEKYEHDDFVVATPSTTISPTSTLRSEITIAKSRSMSNSTLATSTSKTSNLAPFHDVDDESDGILNTRGEKKGTMRWHTWRNLARISSISSTASLNQSRKPSSSSSSTGLFVRSRAPSPFSSQTDSSRRTSISSFRRTSSSERVSTSQSHFHQRRATQFLDRKLYTDPADVVEEITDALALFSRRCNGHKPPFLLAFSSEVLEDYEVRSVLEDATRMSIGRAFEVGDGIQVWRIGPRKRVGS